MQSNSTIQTQTKREKNYHSQYVKNIAFLDALEDKDMTCSSESVQSYLLSLLELLTFTFTSAPL
jgi:hypothetical protein